MSPRLHHNLQSKAHRQRLRQEATEQERKLWEHLRNSKLGYKFRRQQGIGKYIVDFCCPAKKLIIELDGSQHFDDIAYDNDRTLYLESLNYKVIRFWNNEVNKSMDGVIMKIEELLGIMPPPPNPLLIEEGKRKNHV